MTQSQPATGASLQIKTVTQMTQMTQSHADILPRCMPALAATCGTVANGRWPVRRLAAGNTHNAGRGTRRAERKGPAKT